MYNHDESVKDTSAMNDFSNLTTDRCQNRTCDGWVGSVNITSVPCLPPSRIDFLDIFP